MAISVSPYTLHSYSDAALISILRRLLRSFFPIPTGTSLSYFAIFTKIFQPDVDLEKYKNIPEKSFTLCLNDGTPLTLEDFKGVQSYIALQGSWGRPVAANLEGKLVECGLAQVGV